jgi:hypothetical protein
MTSNAQIQNGPKNDCTGFVDWKGLQDFAVAGLILSALTCAGCQQMGFRNRDDEMARLMAEPDDWELPQSPKSRVPRPNVSDFSMQGRREKAITSLGEKNYGSNQRVQRNQNGVVAYGTASQSSEDSDQSAALLLSSANQEIDIESAIASLPPEYRWVLRKQLDATQFRGVATTGSDPTQLNTAIAKPVSQQTDTKLDGLAPTNSTVSSDTTTVERGASKVKMHLSDSDNVSPGGLNTESNSVAFAAANSTVTNAVTTALSTAPPTDGSLANIVPASAVLPVTPSQTGGVGLPPAASASAASSMVVSSMPGSTSWLQSLNQAIEQLEKTIKEVPTSDENLRISQEVTLRLLYVSQRRLKDAMLPIDKLSNGENDYFQHQMQALYEASNPDAMPVPSRHWSLVMNSQREATNHLAAVSNLEVKSVAFCTEVERYGVITKFPKYQFQADQEVLLYCEIENVAATKLKKEGFESQLQGSYEIMDSQGRKIADQLLPMEPEICQNHRRDYFIVYKIYMPQNIATGNYQLRLTVEDMKAHKFGQSHVDFQIKK